MKLLIYEIRIAKGFSLSQLAKRSGVSKTHLSYVENGEKSITVDKLCKVAKALGVTIGELVKCDD